MDGRVIAKEPQGSPEQPEAGTAVRVPRIASATGDAREGMGRLVTENLLAVVDGREPPCGVN
jgi:lactate dehydrogenase-like 2-hydroxyacid dehydrogenase